MWNVELTLCLPAGAASVYETWGNSPMCLQPLCPFHSLTHTHNFFFQRKAEPISRWSISCQTELSKQNGIHSHSFGLMTRSICDSTSKSTDCFRSSLYKKEYGSGTLMQSDIRFNIGVGKIWYTLLSHKALEVQISCYKCIFKK